MSTETTEAQEILPENYEKNFEMTSHCSFSNDFIYETIFKCGIYDFFTKEEIDSVLRDPIGNYDIAIKLSEFVYGKNGIIGNSIDYMTALLTLDRIVHCKRKTKKSEQSRDLMKSTLETINDKAFIRDALFTQMLDGIAFYYFEVTQKSQDKSKFLNDYEVHNIIEINELGINASIITLPWQYTKIVGKKNNRFVIAFNLQYFDDFSGESLERKLRKYPKEIVDGYHKKNQNHNTGNWLVLNSDHTMCRKIKCKNSEPWGRSLIIAALSDVLYKDYFIDTKRNVLNEINNKLIYETFPENKQGTGSSLTKVQQENQHNTLKAAIQNKNNRGGTSFVSLAAGTKLDTIDVSTDIFDNDNECNLNNDIATDLGISAALIGAMVSGNYAAGVSNLEMITAQLYTWVCEWQVELSHVINKCIIKSNDKIELFYFPTSFVNKEKFCSMMKDLYLSGGGSLRFWIASAGIDPDIYLDVLKNEYADGLFDWVKPHQTSFTYSSKDSGRPETDNPSENTILSRTNNGNDIPSPSD